MFDNDEFGDDIDNILGTIDIEPGSEQSEQVDKVFYEGDWRKKQKDLHEKKQEQIDNDDN